MLRILLLLPVLLAVVHGVQDASAKSSRAPRLAVQDLNGRRHDLLSPQNRASVLVFVMTDCPASNKYAPEIKRLRNVYRRHRIPFFSVYVGQGLTSEGARRHARQFGHSPALLDPRGALARRTGATVAPEAVVLAGDRHGRPGDVLYRGRIDDRYFAPGKTRRRPVQRDLQRALDAILEGTPVPQRFTRAIGCFIAAN